MSSLRFLALGLVLALVLFPMVRYASAHQNLNSADESIGNYEVQVATDPEIPAANQHFKLSFRVLNYQSASNLLNSFDTKLSEVNHFRMGVRIYYNNELVDTIPVQDVTGGEWSTTYLFHESGNHVMYVDLYDAGPGGKTLTFVVNVCVLIVFGPLFDYIISAGGISCLVIIGWLVISKRRKVRA